MLDEDGNPLTSESRVGVKLTELTTRRIIFGVLIMLIVVPAFQVDNGFYGGPDPFPVRPYTADDVHTYESCWPAHFVVALIICSFTQREGLYMLHNTYAISGDSSEYQAALMVRRILHPKDDHCHIEHVWFLLGILTRDIPYFRHTRKQWDMHWLARVQAGSSSFILATTLCTTM